MNWSEYRTILEKELKDNKMSQERFDQLMDGIDIIESI